LGYEILDRPTATELAFDDGGRVALVLLALDELDEKFFPARMRIALERRE
jgi:hypothetical protein